ncbi:pre-peptidase C-terminal domain-containing protein [Monaibacterium marinum]|uniref:Pre-peptidase C-terminal domain-containing protein n=1 Tax=Pontivivens marinum TaxID=1690039 RepID=A0A2C9CP26_9RHOB|nr:DVUA0089 family protein [Monaibacterium marinum]SOH92958.1 pre-peptidase C-terminal domain-containing protein [Monaibacterium marinum]
MNLKKLTVTSCLLLGASALPAMAQDDTSALCGGSGADALWAGGTQDMSDISSAEDYLGLVGNIPAGGELTTLFTVSSPIMVRMEAAPTESGDTVIELQDANGMYILSDDDGGGFLSSRAEAQLDPGTYCLVATSYDGADLLAELRVSRMEHETLTSGSSGGYSAVCEPSTEATPFRPEGALDSVLAEGISSTNTISQTPFYRFTLDSTQSLSITAENPNADPVLSLYDDFGQLLAENDDFDGLNSRIDFIDGLQAGTYCIALESLSDEFAPVTVTVSEFSEQQYMQNLYNMADASPPLDGSYPVEALGTLDTRLRRDVRDGDNLTWFSFEVTESGLVLIEGIATAGSDPMLTLFDDLGRRIDQNDDIGGSYDSQIAARVNPGTYVLAVGRPGGYYGTPGMTRLAIQRFVTAQ